MPEPIKDEQLPPDVREALDEALRATPDQLVSRGSFAQYAEGEG